MLLLNNVIEKAWKITAIILTDVQCEWDRNLEPCKSDFGYFLTAVLELLFEKEAVSLDTGFAKETNGKIIISRLELPYQQDPSIFLHVDCGRKIVTYSPEDNFVTSKVK